MISCEMSVEKTNMNFPPYCQFIIGTSERIIFGIKEGVQC